MAIETNKLKNLRKTSSEVTANRTKKVNRTKSSSAFLRVDLQPKECPNLKQYITEQAGKSTTEDGHVMSATAYIQSVLIEDMHRKKSKGTKREKIADMLNKLSDKDIDALNQIIKTMTGE